MKSGKSTIINALIGDNILPARGNPMTTLPTEVVFKNDIESPRLVLTRETINLIVQLQQDIKCYLRNENIHNIFDNQAHLVELVKKIMTTENDAYYKPLMHSVQLTMIQDTLIFINDLIRVFLILSKKEFPISNSMSLNPFLQQNIRLEIPSTSLSDEYLKDIQATIGCLTIVDTPGPNEAQASAELQEIVVRELQRAAMVIIVLNFASMGTVTDDQLFKEVQAIRETNINPDCIYVIVNKVDQRRKGDFNPQQVKQHIAEKYQIVEKSTAPSDARIFEMKAVHCLAFRRFMREYQYKQAKEVKFTIETMATADELLNELYGSHGIEETELEEICTDAKKMWKRGGLKEFLEGPIAELFKTLAPASLQSALSVCFRAGNALKKKVIERQTLLKADITALEMVCAEINSDCVVINGIKSQTKQNLDKTLLRINTEIDKIIKERSEQNVTQINSICKKSETVFDKDMNAYKKQKGLGSGLIVGSFLAASILSGGLLTAVAIAGAGLVAGSSILANMDKEKKFQSKEEAIKFLNELNDEVYDSCLALFNTMRNEIEMLCRRENLSFVKELKAITSNIVEKVNKTFERNFSITPVDLDQIETQTVKTDIDIGESVKMYQPSWGYTLFGRKSELSKERDALQIADVKLQISKEQVEKICRTSTETYIEKFKNQIRDYTSRVIKSKFETYFKNVIGHFRDYEDLIQDTMRQKKASKENQEQFLNDLRLSLEDIEKTSKQLKNIADKMGITLNVR
ncbi:Clamp-binding protein CrfC [Nosema granulosis]|uniref:Clamp-binding protein CrfC n=1 Tax=Nosema granulosis TaxID=83296 RepID=A0A9P6GWU6_9MICR|nr:Clamp-binding protein CrfC [Nosema granulosis]